MATASLLPDAQLLCLAQYLAGEFDNRQQSLADPVWFLHLRMWNRPLPAHVFPNGYGFFIEQVNVAADNLPYRQRILHLKTIDQALYGQYYGLKHPLKFRGSAIQPQRLYQLTQEDLVNLPTCCLTIKADPSTDQFKGRLPADTLCSFTYDGKTSYLSLGFDIGPPALAGNPAIELTVYDRGVDVDTGATTWGPRMGPFQLIKQSAFVIP